MNGELLRLVDSIHRDKDIDKEIIFKGLEDALLSAARKHYGQSESIIVTIDRETGEVLAFDGDTRLAPVEFGRIAAQTAKQVMIQKIKEAESEVIYDEFSTKLHDVVNCTVQRIEGSAVICNLGKVDGILPRREQVKEDTYRPGERLKCFVLDVKQEGQKVKIILSRTHPDIVKRLFEIEVPEVADRIIEIKGIAREPGSRTKIAVVSADTRVDCVGACVGVRGSRIKNIVAELGGEKIDIVPWNSQPEMFIAKALSPAEIYSITLNPAMSRAKVVVPDDQLSLAIGKKGQNVRLAAKLTHWDIDVLGKTDAENLAEEARNALTGIEGASESTIDRLVRLGYNLADLAQIDPQSLTGHESVSIEEAEAIVKVAQRIVYEGIVAVRKPESQTPQPDEEEQEGPQAQAHQEEGAQQQPTEEEAAAEAEEPTTDEEQSGEEEFAEEQIADEDDVEKQTGEEEQTAKEQTEEETIEQPSDSAQQAEEANEPANEPADEPADEAAGEEAGEQLEQETDNRQPEA